ncbi:hypothetical protein B7494_g3206 [Chlorociboria aeruginascens]|nr:hypothetical protein B7494_g3206 [Chlorociboria aeruginascens]
MSGSEKDRQYQSSAHCYNYMYKTNFHQPFRPQGFVRPRSLQPLILLPRSQLRLSYIDIAPSNNILPQSRLFESHIKILELEERMGSQPTVLIARLDDGMTLYVVEREDRGLYVICQLGSWVNLQQLRAAAVASNQELPKPLGSGSGLLYMTGDDAAAPLVTSESSKYTKKKRLAIEAIQSMVKRPPTGILTESQPMLADPEPSQLQTDINGQTLDDLASPPTAAEIFDNVRAQYFEALYLSKASLAYFAKGPLSRARAAFHLDYDSTLEMNDHVMFLESLIMSTTLIDKKYRDGVSEYISSIDIHDHSADEATSGKAKKRKTTKKMKPGKNGLYPSEDSLIRRWWFNHDDEGEPGMPGASKEQTTKSRISQLRIRETQLQLIVILEVLALRPLVLVSGDVEEGLPSALPAGIVTTKSKEKAAKAKKSDQLTALIDFHIDRLCIWQSIELETTKPSLGDSQKTEKLGSSANARQTDNIPRDFCVEVIAPFFSARLPDRCDAINRKLGGPVVVSPPKPKLSKSASFSSALSRPGAATKRPIPAKPRRGLHRVLTDEREQRSMSRGPTRPASLMRSATAPIAPGLKREASEAPSLSNIPLADPQPLQANRGGVLNSKRFSQREVDLSSLAPDLKLKAKKDAVAVELKEAISALKKPNRELAGKALVETAEKRSAMASSYRKSKKPVRNPLFQGVQISATPKAKRQRNIFSQPQPSNLQMPMEDMDIIPPSSLPRISQSAVHSSQGSRTMNPLLDLVQATPTRKMTAISRSGSFLGGGTLDYGGCPSSSPSNARRPPTQPLGIVPESAIKSCSLPSEIQETPVKKRPEIQLGHSHPSSFDIEKGKEEDNLRINDEMKPKTRSSEDSIYKSLGWDASDDLDDLA